ncbi:MAG: N(G),N(G)-dimethylarginine dimethylaminohydrolase [Halofilum sp. (in: g-proteobacteria)]|nr:N(G),N(G)-dimethylarginine dimethylaminohydrolase [Halofilum sp. (in: g-proteobacteria)]
MIALTRAVPDSIERGELTHLERSPIDLARARRQHDAYRAALAQMGCTVRELEPTPALPDSVFVEDAAVVLDELAVITRPGAVSRRPETESVAAALRPWREPGFIEAPGTLDGGDVLCLGRRVFIGETPRSDAEGIRQFRALVAPYGYTVEAVAVCGCLHLKSGVSAIGDATVLLNPDWVDADVFADYERIEVAPGEPFAANALCIDGRVLLPAAFPATRTRVEARGFEVTTVDADELAKAEGGLTCCSLLVAE